MTTDTETDGVSKHEFIDQWRFGMDELGLGSKAAYRFAIGANTGQKADVETDDLAEKVKAIAEEENVDPEALARALAEKFGIDIDFVPPEGTEPDRGQKTADDLDTDDLKDNIVATAERRMAELEIEQKTNDLGELTEPLSDRAKTLFDDNSHRKRGRGPDPRAIRKGEQQLREMAEETPDLATGDEDADGPGWDDVDPRIADAFGPEDASR